MLKKYLDLRIENFTMDTFDILAVTLFLLIVLVLLIKPKPKPKKEPIWKVGDTIYIWQPDQLDDEIFGVHPCYGKIVKKFKNGKYNLCLHHNKKTIRVDECELRR